jgi:hypothetical protein
MDYLKESAKVDYVVNNIILSSTNLLQGMVNELGVSEFAEELDKLEKAKELLMQFNKDVRLKCRSKIKG